MVVTITVMHLKFICSFCKGRTLYSVVRDTKNTLDINKTRQIAQEIVKVTSMISFSVSYINYMYFFITHLYSLLFLTRFLLH